MSTSTALPDTSPTPGRPKAGETPSCLGPTSSVLVLGLGESGLAMAAWAARCGASVTVWDSREHPPQALALAQRVPGATRIGGVLTEDALASVQLVLKSPGLAPGDARIATLLAHARASAIPVQGEVDLFAQALADLREIGRAHV